MSRIALLISLLLATAAFADGYQEAVDHPDRPAADRADDDRRKPVEVMAFAGVSEGYIVIDLGAGGGYTTELAARLVGEKGRVYAQGLDASRTARNRLPNVVSLPPHLLFELAARLEEAGLKKGTADRVLAFFTLHDMYLNDNIDKQRLYRVLLDFLKPGGEFIVLDSTAREGSALADTRSLHRIDPEFLKHEVLKAGFEFAGESNVLRNPDDDLQSRWNRDTETRARGYHDRFAFSFRKPQVDSSAGVE